MFSALSEEERGRHDDPTDEPRNDMFVCTITITNALTMILPHQRYTLNDKTQWNRPKERLQTAFKYTQFNIAVTTQFVDPDDDREQEWCDDKRIQGDE